MKGYVLVHRKLTDNPVWTQLEPSVLKVMLAFLLLANWRAKSWYDGRNQVEIPRGSFVTSYAKIAKFCRLTTRSTRTAFTHLANLDFATYQRAPHWTIVTVLNYEAYQTTQDESDRADDKAATGQAHPRRQGVRQQLKKVIREIEELTTSAAKGSGSASLFSVNNSPFSTLDPEPGEKPSPSLR